jgi:hypothetical protein
MYVNDCISLKLLTDKGFSFSILEALPDKGFRRWIKKYFMFHFLHNHFTTSIILRNAIV